MSRRRLLKEKQDCQATDVPHFSLTEDLYRCYSALLGPANTPYEDGVYFLSFLFPRDYPFKPPQVCFLTPIYHPNVNSRGVLSCSILHDQWSPALSLPILLRCFEDLLKDPNSDYPLHPEAAQLYEKDRVQYWLKAETMKRQYAT